MKKNVTMPRFLKQNDMKNREGNNILNILIVILLVWLIVKKKVR